jgi:hypothetical protein
MQRGRIQDRILTQLCDGVEKIEDVDWNKADTLVRTELTPLELS